MHHRLTPLFLLLCLATSASAQQAQQAEAQRLIAQVRRPAMPLEERTKLAEQLLELGTEGPKRLAPLARTEFVSRRNAYAARFERAAGDLLRSRLTTDALREVEARRQEVRDVTSAPQLTKDLIVSKADPALKRLEELLGVTPEQVTESSAELKSQRAELLAWLGWAVAAVEKVPEAERKNLPTVAELKALQPELEEAEALVALMATPMSNDDRRVLLANVPLARQLDAEEARGILYLNRLRLFIGLNAQSIDPALCAAGRGHSKEMVEKKFFAHQSPTPGRESPWQRAQLAGTRASAENIYAGSGKGEDAIKAWWHSPGHHKNMTGAHKRTGLGRHEKHWTQMFG